MKERQLQRLPITHSTGCHVVLQRHDLVARRQRAQDALAQVAEEEVARILHGGELALRQLEHVQRQQRVAMHLRELGHRHVEVNQLEAGLRVTSRRDNHGKSNHGVAALQIVRRCLVHHPSDLYDQAGEL